MRERLQRGAAAMGIALDATALDRLEGYAAFINETNKTMNLTTVKTPDEMADRHFLDSLAPLSLGLLQGTETIADVGTGAGFPGLPLLIARPTLALTFVDSQRKKLDFVWSVLEKLGLRAETVHARVEDFARLPARREQYAVAVARAVANASTLMEYLLPCVRLGGCALAWKGPAAEECGHAVALLGGAPPQLLPYAIPGRDWSHTLLRVKKTAATPKAYPRKAGLPAKNPL